MGVVSLKTIATRIGVSEQTVSRALRGERYVKPALAQKIRKMADQLGYRPNPRIKALLGQMRQRKTREESIALILPQLTEKEAAAYHFQRDFIKGARLRADQTGFLVEVHSLLAYPSQSALERVLRARGIELLVIGPVSSGVKMHFNLRWDQYAAVLVGPGIWRPRLNRVLPNYYLNMTRVLREVRRLGYRRPALVMEETVIARSAGLFEAAFLEKAPLLGLKDPRRHIWSRDNRPTAMKKACAAWLRKIKADVVISDKQGEWLLIGGGLSVPDEIGFASLTWNRDYSYVSGLNVRTDLLGAHAVDAVAGQYYRNERGIPGTPKFIVHEGEWQKGSTLALQKH